MGYQYFGVFHFIVISIIFTFLLVFIGDNFSSKMRDSEKYSSYECGFQPFDVLISRFEIKYYLVALLFLIFDVEIVILIPFISCLDTLNTQNFVCFILFYYVLLFALVYEWWKSYLDWN